MFEFRSSRFARSKPTCPDRRTGWWWRTFAMEGCCIGLNNYLKLLCKFHCGCRILTTGESAMKPETLEERLLKRIDRKRGAVFLRTNFGDLGGYDQVGRVLRDLVRKGQLVRVGQGLYARARPSITS